MKLLVLASLLQALLPWLSRFGDTGRAPPPAEAVILYCDAFAVVGSLRPLLSPPRGGGKLQQRRWRQPPGTDGTSLLLLRLQGGGGRAFDDDDVRRHQHRVSSPLSAHDNDNDNPGEPQSPLNGDHRGGSEERLPRLDPAATSSSSAPKVPLTWKSVSRQFDLFSELALAYYKESVQGRVMLIGLVGLTLLNSGVSVTFSYLSRDFWNALSSANSVEFAAVLSRYLGALLVGAPIITLWRYQREQLSVHWREWMTARTFSLYVKDRVYYNLAQQDDTPPQRQQPSSTATDSLTTNGEADLQQQAMGATQQQQPQYIDNPDQRIQEDVNSFTSFSLQLVITALTSIIDLWYVKRRPLKFSQKPCPPSFSLNHRDSSPLSLSIHSKVHFPPYCGAYTRRSSRQSSATPCSAPSSRRGWDRNWWISTIGS